MSLIHTAAFDHVEVLGSFYLLKTSGCPWPGLLLEAMLMFVVHTAAEGHVDVCGPSCYCRCLWSLLLLEAMLICVACVAV